MIPGPTNVDPSVLRALSRPTESHVSGSFAQVFKETIENLAKVMSNRGQTFIVSGSGTLAMEMAIANVVEPGDRVLCVCNGHFAERFVPIVEGYGAQVDRLEVEWGQVADPKRVREKLEAGSYKAVTVCHVDTSTGAANRAKEIGEVMRSFDSLYILDTVCSLGGMDVKVSDWNVDLCISGSQKALAIPPGLAIVSGSDEAMDAYRKRKTKVSLYYGNFANWQPIMEDPKKYFATPPVNMIYALHKSLQMILEEGLERRFKRHQIMSGAFRAAMEALKLRLVAKEECASDTVSAIYYPSKVDDEAFRTTMAGKHHVVVAGGIGKLKSVTFRVGHMGNIDVNDILSTVGAIERTLKDQGYLEETGHGVSAANNAISQVSLS